MLCSSRLHLIDQKYSNTVKLWNIIQIKKKILFEYILKCNLFMWYKAEFSASLLQSSLSNDSSEIILIRWFADQKIIS